MNESFVPAEVPTESTADEQRDRYGGLRVLRRWRRPSQAELQKSSRTGVPPASDRLRQLIDEAAVGCDSVSELARRLYEKGVTVGVRWTAGGALCGLSFRLDDWAFPGWRLGSAYAWPALQRRGISYVEARDREVLKSAYGEEARADDVLQLIGTSGDGSVEACDVAVNVGEPVVPGDATTADSGATTDVAVHQRDEGARTGQSTVDAADCTLDECVRGVDATATSMLAGSDAGQGAGALDGGTGDLAESDGPADGSEDEDVQWSLRPRYR
jgi:hypothetical protein